MAISVDTRSSGYKRDFDLEKIDAALRERLPNTHQVTIRGVNSFLGSAQQVYSEFTNYDYSSTVESTLADNALIDLAQQHVQLISPALGFYILGAPEFIADPHVKVTDTGERIVNLQQYYHGIPIFEMERTVWMEADGTVYNVTGTSVGLPDNLTLVPTVSAAQALLSALTHLTSFATNGFAKVSRPWWTSLKNQVPKTLATHLFPSPPTESLDSLKSYVPKILATHASPSRPTVLGKGFLGEAVAAHLVFLYMGKNTKLAWHLIISAPKLAGQYSLIVEAHIDGDSAEAQVLYCQETSKHIGQIKIQGNVWLNNPDVNASTKRQLVDFPRPKSVYPIDSLPDFPSPWLDGDTSLAGGNCTIVVQGVDDDSEDLPEPVAMNLNPKVEDGDEQRVLNAFFFCCFLHDFFYSLGFTEGAKNFQRVNPNGNGVGGDPVVVRISAETNPDSGSFITRADGSTAHLDVRSFPDTNHHGAIDADVIFHEYTHGVTGRLVGSISNPQPLEAGQSSGMSEGWSDYFALTIQNFYLEPGDRDVIGRWLTGKPLGLRNCHYNDALAGNPLGHFGAIGKPTGPDRPGRPSSVMAGSHEIGRIWCGALMKMNRDLVKLFGKPAGHLLGWQIVMAGLRFTPANPNFLQGRDGIIHALKCRRRKKKLSENDFKDAYNAVWTAFTVFGVGAKASCKDSGLAGLEEDTDIANIPPPNLLPLDPL